MSPARTVSRRPSAGTRRRTAGPKGRRRPARRRSGTANRLRGANWWPAALVTALMLVGLAWSRAEGSAAPGPAPALSAHCTIAGTAFSFTGEQIANARAIAAVAADRGLPERAVVIALATAQQESRLRNLPYGDRDSLGLFQQRPSMGWGTPAQVQDPAYAAGKFFDRLVQVPGWQTGRLTEVAQAVQRSGFPEAYQKHGPMAAALTAALAGRAELACR